MNRRNVLQTLLVAAGVAGGSLVAPQSADAADLTGYWEGRWRSCKTGHNGLLRGSFCRVSEYAYRVDFSGRFFKLFPFRYSVVLNVVEDRGNYVRLQGSSYLGRMFGTFYYDATIVGCQFNAAYTSCKDNGTFHLTKLC